MPAVGALRFYNDTRFEMHVYYKHGVSNNLHFFFYFYSSFIILICENNCIVFYANSCNYFYITTRLIPIIILYYIRVDLILKRTPWLYYANARLFKFFFHNALPRENFINIYICYNILVYRFSVKFSQRRRTEDVAIINYC